MIALLQILPLFLYGLWHLRRAVLARHAKTAGRPAFRVTSDVGLEDDPVRWPARDESWTALDEQQLIRLLKDSTS